MADLDDLLRRTSRTFGISIPLLPEPARRQVTVAYLLFRIADSFEDADHWEIPRRITALGDWARLLAAPDPREARRLAAEWSRSPPCELPDYNELVAEVPAVLAALAAIDGGIRGPIAGHAARTTRGMAEVLGHCDEGGFLALPSVDALIDYCYTVAGIVGEMLTDVFLFGWPPLAAGREGMIRGSHRFGEALQLINILKDADADRRAGRCYLPANAETSELHGLAAAGLDAGADYIHALGRGGAPDGYGAFLTVPLFLGWSTLEALEAHGAGAKVGRDLVRRVLAKVAAAFSGHHAAYDRDDLRALWAATTPA